MPLSKDKIPENLFQNLQLICDLIPTPVYWMDPSGAVFAGVNKYGLKTIQTSHTDFVGKSLYDLYPFEMAKVIADHNKLVMQQDEVLSQEETIVDVLGNVRHFVAIKAPLSGNGGEVIGVIGTSIEITKEKEAERLRAIAQKEAEKLRQENERQQIALEQEEHFAKLARKVAHDINSPLAALKMVIEVSKEIPEAKRLTLRRATDSILDISNNLIANYHKDKNQPTLEVEPRQPVLVSDLLVQLLSEKKMQYRNRAIRFELDIANEAQFAFIRSQRMELRRALSNLINNAVDASSSKEEGVITLQLKADTGSVEVSVVDAGGGMPEDSLQRIRDKHGFTEGKKGGHGLGLQQVWDMLDYNQGILDVQSTLGQGTSFRLTFPRVAAADWIIQKLHVKPDHQIVILDDEESIHGAWDMHIAPLLKSHPTLKVHHFTQGKDVLDFCWELNSAQKDKAIFLSDYELLNQEKNGLEIISASKIKQSVLVTSYYSDLKIQEAATKIGVKILPKQLASVIPIYIEAEAA